MAEITFDSLEEAQQRSRELWVAILGREKRPEDVTEFAYRAVDAAKPYIMIQKRDAMLDTLILQEELTADELAALVSVYPVWATGTAYVIGDLASYDGTLYRCVQAHRSQADWTPPVVPALWASTVPEGVIPEWVQPQGAHDAYALGAQVTHNGYIWESTIAANVWEPGAPGTTGLWTNLGPV